MKKYAKKNMTKLVLFIVAKVCGYMTFHPMKGRGLNKVFRGTGSHRQVKPLWTDELLYQKKYSLDFQIFLNS